MDGGEARTEPIDEGNSYMNLENAVREFRRYAAHAKEQNAISAAETAYRRQQNITKDYMRQAAIARNRARETHEAWRKARMEARANRVRDRQEPISPETLAILRTMAEKIEIRKDLTGTPVSENYQTGGPYLVITTHRIDVRGLGRMVGRYQVAVPLNVAGLLTSTRGWALDGQKDPVNTAYEHPNISPTTHWFCLNQYRLFLQEAILARDLLQAVRLTIDALVEGPTDIYLDTSSPRPR